MLGMQSRPPHVEPASAPLPSLKPISIECAYQYCSISFDHCMAIIGLTPKTRATLPHPTHGFKTLRELSDTQCEQTTDKDRYRACIGGFRERVACHVHVAPHNKHEEVQARPHTLVPVHNGDFDFCMEWTVMWLWRVRLRLNDRSMAYNKIDRRYWRVKTVKTIPASDSSECM